jgi:hypothetical protein
MDRFYCRLPMGRGVLGRSRRPFRDGCDNASSRQSRGQFVRAALPAKDPNLNRQLIDHATRGLQSLKARFTIEIGHALGEIAIL